MRTPARPPHTRAGILLASLGLVIGALALTAPAADAAPVDPFTYAYDPGNVSAGATVTDYDTDAGGQTPVIPTTITVDDTVYDVTAIGDFAFDQDHLTSVTLPERLRTIGGFAFQINDLTSVTFPDSLTTIGEHAFQANNLASVTIPESVTSLGGAAFENSHTSSLTFEAGSALTFIGNRAFGNSELASLTIPASVTTIDNEAFINSPTIASLTFEAGSHLASIGDYAFRGTQITSLDLPSSLTTIGVNAFVDSNKLASLTFAADSHLTTIGTTAFTNNALTALSLPSSLTSIGEHAFQGGNLATLTFPTDGPDLSFGNRAFADNNLTTVTIPGKVPTVGVYAFVGNPIASATFLPGVQNIGGSAFQSVPLTSVSFPAGLTTVGEAAFMYTQLTSVTLPGSLTSIDRWAFLGTPLEAATFAGDAPSIQSASSDFPSFEDVDTNFVIHYRSTATGFGATTFAGYPAMSEIRPTVTGTLRKGSTVTATPGVEVPESGNFSRAYQWYADGVAVSDATGNTLTLGQAQAGRHLSVVETFTSPNGAYVERARSARRLVGSSQKRIIVPASSIKRRAPFSVIATGLKPGQRYIVWLDNKKTVSGHADAYGSAEQTVRFPASVTAGKRRVRVSGYTGSKLTYTVYTFVTYLKK